MQNKSELFSKINSAIISFKQETLEYAINEINYIDNKAKVCKWFPDGNALVELSVSFDELLKGFSYKKPIFLQHIFPCLLIFDRKDFDSDTQNLLEYIYKIKQNLSIEKSFSVQSRFSGTLEDEYKKHKLNDCIANFLKTEGYELNIKSPEQIISVLVTQDSIYLGLSESDDNLSIWAGGIHRFYKDEHQVSRAEFKLLEALEYFKIEHRSKGSALDLGAAPGGWSRVLALNGFNVVAVDPAKLNEDVLKNYNIVHYKETTQEFLKRDLRQKFEIIVNDMKIDAVEACFLMGQVSEFLQRNGVLIMTLKLPKKGMQKRVKKALDILAKFYNIIGVRQLFHNRCEVTVVLEKLSELKKTFT